MQNVPELFKSKRFWSAFGYVLALAVVFYAPIFEGSEEQIATLITVIAGLLIGGYAAEDVVQVIVIARALAAKTPGKADDMVVESLAGMATAAGLPVPPAVEVNINDAAHG